MKKGLLNLLMLWMALSCCTLPADAQVVELLKDIYAGSSGSCTYYNYMSKANGKLFMMADDGIHGDELWFSDGTEAGTKLLQDIRSGSASGEAGWKNNFAFCNNKLFFIANNGLDGGNNYELFVTDGTTEGTHIVKDIGFEWGGLPYSSSKNALYVYNNKVYFCGSDGDPYFGSQFHGQELWCSDGTAEGTYMVKDIHPSSTNYGQSGSSPQRFTEFKGLLYFIADDGVHDMELWVTDGTEEGTHLFKDIAGNYYSETPEFLTPCGDLMFFRTKAGPDGRQLWATDGTEEGTFVVPGVPSNISPKFLTVNNGTLFFNAWGPNGISLWKTDGTLEGTANLFEGVDVHNPVNLKAYKDKIIFLAYDGQNTSNYELYSWSEATGVQLVKEINPSATNGVNYNPESTLPEGFVEYRDKLYFRAAVTGSKFFLWETDGTEAGTMQTPGQVTTVSSPLIGDEFTFLLSYGSLFYPARYNTNIGREVYRLTVAPTEVYAVTGGGDYCQGDVGIPVGLSGSEEGVTYTLYKDGLAQAITVEGTGNAITFGNQTAGTYTVSAANVAGVLQMEGSAVANATSSLPVSISILATDEDVCAGVPVTFSATIQNGGANPSYQWYVNDQEMGDMPTYTYFSWIPGTYHVYAKLTSSLSCAGNIAVSNSISLVINNFVTPEVSITASENPVYSANPVTFTPSPVNGGTASYEWFVNSVLVGMDNTYAYLPINEDQVYVKMTSSLECVTTTTAQSDVIAMIVNNGIPAAYTVTGGGNYCEGSGGLPVGLSDSEIGVLYTLYKDGLAQTTTVEGTGEAISFGNQLAGTYTIVGSNPLHTATMAGSAVIVEVVNLPVSVTIGPNYQPICSNSSVIFYANAQNIGNAPTYHWFKNGVAIEGFNFNQYQFVPIDGDKVYVEVTSSLECTINNPATSEVYELDVLPMLIPAVSIIADHNEVCEGASVTISAIPVNGGDQPVYHWYLNDLPAGSNEASFSYVPSDGDRVNVVMEVDPNLQCSGNSAAESNTIFVTVNDFVTPSITIAVNNNPVFVGEAVTFTPTPVNGGLTPTYQWFVNGVFAGDLTPFTYTPANGDQVYAKMTSSLACVTAAVVVSNTINMIVLSEYPNVAINPNALVQNFNVPNGQATELVQINNSGAGQLYWNAAVEYLSSKDVQMVPEGPVPSGAAIGMSKGNSSKPGSFRAKVREDVVLHYDNENNDGIGLTSGGTFNVAARFPSAMTTPYAGYELQSVDVYISAAFTSATLKIWDAGTTTTPGTLLHQQSFTGTGWLTIELSNPLVLSGADIWVGYAVTHAGGAHPAGCDAGPANANGDWISTDGSSWEHLSGFGLNYNWNIRANLSGNSFSWLSISPTSGIVEGNSISNLEVHFDATGLDNQIYTANILFSSNDPETPLVTIPVTMAITVGVNENSASTIEVYPNPTKGMLYMNLPADIRTVALYNAVGQQVRSTQLSGERQLSWNVQSLPAGTYHLRFIGNDGSIHHKKISIM